MRRRCGLDEGIGIGESGAEGWAGLRLCNLVAQSSGDAQGPVQAGGGESTDRAGKRAMEDYLLQTVPKPDSGHRARDRDGSSDAGK